MNNMPEFMNSRVSVEFKKKKTFFKSDDETILELRPGKKKRATFKWDDKTYTIRNRGFWNPVTVLEEDDKQIVTLKRFFRVNKAFIEFKNGNRYLCKTQNAVFVKLAVFSADRKEIITYRLVSKYKASLHLNASITEIPAEDLIFLLALSCFVFRGILKENKVVDLESVVFSNPVPVKEMPVTEPV